MRKKRFFKIMRAPLPLASAVGAQGRMLQTGAAKLHTPPPHRRFSYLCKKWKSHYRPHSRGVALVASGLFARPGDEDHDDKQGEGKVIKDAERERGVWRNGKNIHVRCGRKEPT